MRLSLILPPVRPEVDPEVAGYPDGGCGGRHVQPWQAVRKPLRDTQLHEVVAQRYRCVRCGRTFRVYPVGVSHDQTSARLKGAAVMFYVLGMRSGAAAAALAALGWPLSKVAVSYAVQEAGAAVAGLRRAAVRRGGGRVAGLGVDLTTDWLAHADPQRRQHWVPSHTAVGRRRRARGRPRCVGRLRRPGRRCPGWGPVTAPSALTAALVASATPLLRYQGPPRCAGPVSPEGPWTPRASTP